MLKSDFELSRTDGRKAFMALRTEAEKNGIQDLTLDEINEEIRRSRYGENQESSIMQ